MKRRTRITSTPIASIPVLIVAACLTPAILSAQQRSIAVDANASVTAKADQLKFSVNLMKSGVSIKKAKSAFDDQKKAFNTTFNVMKFKGLSRKTTSKSISTQPIFPDAGMAMAPAMAFGGGGAVPMDAAESQIYISETIEFTIDGIDKWSEEELDKEILNYVTELKKLSLAPTSGFSTSLSQPGLATQKAFGDAMKKARSNATVLAELSEGIIGKVLNVEQTSGLEDFANNPYAAYAYQMSGMNYGMGGISPTITIQANLRVTFELKD